MLVNRRKWYCTRLANFLALHPEHLNTFIVNVCDEISISEIDAIYRQMHEVSKQPPDKELIKILEN